MARDSPGGQRQGIKATPAVRPSLAQTARRLWDGLEGPRFMKFCAVGFAGIGVNVGILVLLHELLFIPRLPAFAVGTEVSILSNFALNDRWTFRDRLGARGLPPLAQRVLRYNLGYVGGVAIQLALFFLLAELLGLYYPAAALLAITASTFWNYGVSRGKVWEVAA